MAELLNVSCPICGKEMEQGYIFSSREIAWTKDGKNRIAPGLHEYETLVSVSDFTVKKEVAYRCKDCNIALFEYR